MKTISAVLLSVVVLAALVISFDTVGALPTGLQTEEGQVQPTDLEPLYENVDQTEEDQVQLTDLEPLDEHVDDNGGDDNAGIRQARFTCDLLSFQSKWLTMNHSVCAAKCIVLGKKGGVCDGGICYCRR